jgi:hypothetical protein
MALKLKPFPPHLQQFPKNHRRLLPPLRGSAWQIQIFIVIIRSLKAYVAFAHVAEAWRGPAIGPAVSR